MRTLPLTLLFLVATLSGCLGGGAAPQPGEALDPIQSGSDSEWNLTIDAAALAVMAGESVVLQANSSIASDLIQYEWLVEGVVTTGPTLVAVLEAGFYEINLTARLNELSNTAQVVVNVVPTPDSTNEPGGGDTEPAEPPELEDDPSLEDEPEPEPTPEPTPCAFPDTPIRQTRVGHEYTFSYPWSCQPDSWQWDLGDGTYSRAATVKHAYTRDQTYTVTLTIDHDGETLTRTGTVEVTNVPLRIVSDIVEDHVSFSLTWGRDLESASWTFGDGSGSLDLAPSHTFDSKGPWTITAHATATDGSSSSATKSISLDDFPLRIVSVVDKDMASFAYTWGWPPDTIEWTFGHDQSTSASSEPEVQYTEPGTYEVRLELTSGLRSATAVSTVIIEDIPLRIAAVQDKNTITFTPIWYETPSNILWDFGDGFSSSDEVATHTYYDYTDFTVELSGAKNGVALSSIPLTVTIDEIPLDLEGVLGDDNKWNGVAHWAPATSITWNMGDGLTETGVSVEHQYPKKGTYNVVVQATDGTHTETAVLPVVVPTGLMPEWGLPEDAAVRPGTQMHTSDGQCTTAFLLHEAATRFFMATAAHCAGAITGDSRGPSEICAENVSSPLGTTVSVENWKTGSKAFDGTLAYSSWKTMNDLSITDADMCKGNDFAIVEIPASALDQVHPAVLVFEGPLQSAPPGDALEGTEVRAYGASSTRNSGAVGDNHEVNVKGGEYVDYDDGWLHHVRFTNPAIPGDSGGPLLNVEGDALGVASTVVASTQAVTNRYTDLARAIDWMNANADLDVELIPWTDWDPTMGTQPPETGCMLGMCGSSGPRLISHSSSIQSPLALPFLASPSITCEAAL